MAALSTPIGIGASVLGIVLVACAANGADRTPFSTMGAEVPTEPPKEVEPPPPNQDAPATPTGDAGKTDASDDCKKAPPSNACGVVPQCGCAATETCDVIDAKGNVGCVAAGKAPMGYPCTSTPGCKQGLLCVFGTCHAPCNNPGSACTVAGTGACLQVNATGGVAIPNLAVCLVACDPVSTTSCGGKTNAGTGVCLVGNDGTTDCQEGGSVAENGACSPQAECGPGLVCIKPATGTDTCKRWCRVAQGKTDCGGSADCRGFQTKIMVGSVEYGACP
jgi:hypothetical protein